jgi:hypothetical protein
VLPLTVDIQLALTLRAVFQLIQQNSADDILIEGEENNKSELMPIDNTTVDAAVLLEHMY